MGLKHQTLTKDINDPIKAVLTLMTSIHPSLNAAETDYAALHLLEFNGKIQNEVIKDGFKYSLNDLYICQRLEFQYGGTEYKFRSHIPFEQFGPIDTVLKSLYLGDDVPDFLDMPAFVSKWADDITNTVAIPGPKGPIKGISAIMDILNEKQI
ncbi:baseplate hub distal subunit [Pectobacterium bacteriophage PM2]|uniref:Baseplate hub distal subunit n=1 Tax=Pectobacterium bacteriophage PM2 TaxID=1429794 RepID=A0A0A0Q2G9_9CAUD|nr:baseplate hub distal subunit [Pectobacterium bacteriophage PM2]AHY25175.1 baseplate hub distal subunit [Pectobacterium bacteriophage PM2]